MRVTVIVPDSVVLVDGLAFNIQMPPNLGNLHAIQLYEDGHIEAEYTNAKITDPAAVAAMIQPFLDGWTAAKAARDIAVSPAAAQQAAAAAAIAEGTQAV